jgi:hypothetical protein
MFSSRQLVRAADVPEPSEGLPAAAVVVQAGAHAAVQLLLGPRYLVHVHNPEQRLLNVRLAGAQ